jgi:hypothetical protein
MGVLLHRAVERPFMPWRDALVPGNFRDARDTPPACAVRPT